MATLDTPRLTEALRLLTHPHRRFVLYYLTRGPERVDIRSLAAAISEWENCHTGKDHCLTRRDVEVGLRHTHLPKLAEAGLVSFDVNKNSIEHGETGWLDQFLVDTISIDGYTKAATGD